MPIAVNGSLHQLLKTKTEPIGTIFNVPVANQFSDWDLRFKLALNICDGMTFLHANNCLHSKNIPINYES